MAEKYYGINGYGYCAGNPIRLIDAYGEEPIKPQAGTVRGFVNELSTSGTRSGLKAGIEAHDALLLFGDTEWSLKTKRPMPTHTGKINTYQNKYIYTTEGGWIDMAHFIFYAGRAYKYKVNGVKNPVAKAIHDGYRQETTDILFAPYSAYSYEDLPSDKFGAEFGAIFFDPNSKQTLGEQIESYLNNVLKACVSGKSSGRYI